MLSNKLNIRNLVEICAAKGIQYVIISPGSRNAPLNISFNEDGGFTCLSIPDERVAAFVALGIAQQTGKPAIITCTSGSAALNFAPAISEAYYQQIPMLILTADRPIEWRNQGDGQTINQLNIFQNYIKKSYELHQETTQKDEVWHNGRIVNEAIEQTMHYGNPGPVHINIPLREPIYDVKDYSSITLPKIADTLPTIASISNTTIQQLATVWNQSQKKLVLCGLLSPNEKLNKYLGELAKDDSVIVLTETTSNLQNDRFYTSIDRLIETITPDEISNFQPEILVTIGHSIVSKRIKATLRKNSPILGWHIGLENFHLDTFQSLTQHIPVLPADFFAQLLPYVKPQHTDYFPTWKTRDEKTEQIHFDYLKSCQWSDLKAFEHILQALPKGSNLHQGNSTPVRYVQLFPQRKDLIFNSNRGTSGIDGCTSTAAGAALVNGRPTTIISGDISFFYDANAFWNHHLTPNLRVIVLNNGGGNIFRYIKGPDTTKQLEQFFETHHEMYAKPIADLHHINYYSATSESTLISVLNDFYQKQSNNRPAILEIFTPRFENDKVLKSYFERLRKI